MAISGYAFSVFLATCLMCGAAFATPVPAPAPLLAAGIPAFAALGGGVAVTKIVRRLRKTR
jgi:hypothetical protein